MKRALAVVALALCLTASATLALASPTVEPAVSSDAAGVSAAARTGHSPSVGVVVRFKDPSNAGLTAKLLAGVDGSSAQPANSRRGVYEFRTPETQSAELYSVQLMLQAPGVAYAEPNYVRQPMGYVAPTDPDFSDATTWYDGVGYFVNGKHWWLGQINAEPAWQIGQGAAYPVHGSADDIKVADIDSGMYLTHADLSGGTFVVGKDYFTSLSPYTGFGAPDNDVTPALRSTVSAW